MHIGSISGNYFGLKFTDRAMEFFEEKYKKCPQKLLDVDKLEFIYPDDITLDIKKNNGDAKSFTCLIKDRGSKNKVECSFPCFHDIYEIESFIKSYLNSIK